MKTGINKKNMYCGIYAPWDHYPKSLRVDEVQNPLKVVDDFFSLSWPDEHLAELKAWRRFVVSSEVYNDKQQGQVNLLLIYDYNIRLIEAMYLLLLSHSFEPGDVRAISEERLTFEKNDWRFFPDNLTPAELVDPYVAIKKFFQTITPQQYRDYLHEWLYAALNNNPEELTLSPSEIIEVYENLQKLYAAAWVTHQRHSDALDWSDQEAKSPQHLNYSEAGLYHFNNDFPEQHAGLINDVIQSIQEVVPLVQAVYFLGTPPDESNHLYLLVLTPKEEKRNSQALAAMIEDIFWEEIRLFILVHYTTSLVSGLTDGHIFFQQVLKRKLLYLSGHWIPPVYQDRVDSRDLSHYWLRWFGQGSEFLKGSDLMLSNQAYGTGLFLLHQCAECLLIAIIRVILGYRINNHNLLRLLRISQMFTGDLIGVFELDYNEGRQSLMVLKEAYINIRYKDNYQADADSVRLLSGKVKKLKEVAQALYEKHILLNTI